MKFFRKTEVWLLTRRSALLVFSVLTLLAAGLFYSVYPFLALSRPLPQAGLVIIEGWLPDTALVDVLEDADGDALFVTTGGPIKFGGDLFKDRNYADLTATRLTGLGVPARRILAAPAPDSNSDRTYTAALAVRRALDEADQLGRSANLYSLGAHSRRSFELYRFALGPDAPLGVVSVECREIDLRHWWRNSEGFKHLAAEAASWLYVQCTRWKYTR